MTSIKKYRVDENQILLVMTGFSCNDNCIMCSTKPKSLDFPDRSTKEIISDLINGRKQGYVRIEFTGGEPTIRKDILYLVKKARDLGYRDIGLSTNGRMLSYDKFSKAIYNNGLRRINVSLYGYNSKTHDSITRTPRSFEQTIQGVKNFSKYSDVSITINTVVFKLNYNILSKIAKFVLSLGIKYWNLLDLIPDGYAKINYKYLSVDSLIDLSRNLNKLSNIIPLFSSVTFFDFPLCLFSQNFRRIPNVSFISAQGRIEITKQIGYKPKRFSVVKKSQVNDIHKRRLKVCNQCKFRNSCGGIWKDYIKIHGGDEIKVLASKNKCLQA